MLTSTINLLRIQELDIPIYRGETVLDPDLDMDMDIIRSSIP
jgi:hypothetical protein